VRSICGVQSENAHAADQPALDDIDVPYPLVGPQIARPVAHDLMHVDGDRTGRQQREAHGLDLRIDRLPLPRPVDAYGIATEDAAAFHAVGPVDVIVHAGQEPLASSLAIPFFKSVLIDLGWLFIPFGAFIIVGAGNAVNLTDGLDGLAIVPVMIAAAAFGFISYLVGNVLFADYLQIHFVQGTGELAVVCGALVGAGLGFLWFNAPPALIFMGDTGSLALGGALGTIAVATKHELVLAIVGGLFVLEAASVIVQVTSFRLFGKRVFRMAPLHHHFEQKGWPESTVVIRFWIISVVLALAGLATLKLR